MCLGRRKLPQWSVQSKTWGELCSTSPPPAFPALYLILHLELDGAFSLYPASDFKCMQPILARWRTYFVFLLPSLGSKILSHTRFQPSWVSSHFISGSPAASPVCLVQPYYGSVLLLSVLGVYLLRHISTLAPHY